MPWPISNELGTGPPLRGTFCAARMSLTWQFLRSARVP